MADQTIQMNVKDTLELDYLIEEISEDVLDIKDKPQSSAPSVEYIKSKTGVFDPDTTG